ncbi:MAG: hypothetical protein F6K26_02400 [Moorea sp. SIO2I5]|nr:hypothetical protein [Moorena sp. SIO2I5]
MRSHFPIPDSRFPIPDSRFPIPDSRFPIPDSLLPKIQPLRSKNIKPPTALSHRGLITITSEDIKPR